ncbi:sensor histidine kinase [Bradyrhizobium elkanii]|uniref:sensor histidine kinase n=1 Tax=Bradyrhizobium elkanii TaxID=29448 RepID=UPI001BA7B1C2|nr:PAS domain-containing protein [Bradyrhizobium elkanii]MBR1159685.1 PAS domain-containing protein [Bradyrhizobium elkanii]
MVLTNKKSAAESEHLQRRANELIDLLSRPEIWRVDSLSQVLSDLLDVLVKTFQLDCLYARLHHPASSVPIEIARGEQLQGATNPLREIAADLNDSQDPNARKWPCVSQIAIGCRTMSVAAFPLGLHGGLGLLIAASLRPDFLGEADRLRLTLAANQTTIALQEARRLGKRQRTAAIIDRRLAQRTRALVNKNRELEDEIAARKRLEEARRIREIDIQMVVDAVPAPIAIMTAEGKVEAVNRPVLEYFGKTVEELKRWTANDAVHPDDLAPSIATWAKAVEAGDPYEIESRHRRSDGVYRWFHVRGFPLRDGNAQIIRWCVLLIDIEDRKRAEQALRASERDLNMIINTIPAAVWSARPDGSAEFFNQHYLDYVSRSSEQMRDWGWTAAVHPDDLNALTRAWNSIMASRQPGEAEARLRRFDGTYRWFLFRASPLRDRTGNVIKWFGINIHIEDRKRAEEELRETQAKLAHMTRVMTIGELTASIAHEISQPLSGIVTNSSTCLRMLTADPPNLAGARETVRRTMRDGRRASEIIARLRALFNRRAPVAGALDLNEAIREVIALSLNKFYRDGVILRTELAEDLPLVAGDRVQLQQVILNLLHNATDAMSMTDDRARELAVKTERDGDDAVRLSIQDSGSGFDPAVVDRLFEAFYTTKDEGMGIGLSVSRSIIENHRGRLWATLNDGRGATFSFSIPRVPDDAGGAHGFGERGTSGGGSAARTQP